MSRRADRPAVGSASARAPAPRDYGELGPRLLMHLRSRRDEMTSFLRELALAESPSTVPSSQERVLRLLAGAAEEGGLRTRRLSGRLSGGLLYARPASASAPFQLVLGHGDTVWPLGAATGPMPVEVEGDVMRGPGVFDMKGGLTQAVFALRALHDLGLRPSVAPVLLVTSDEEVGSPDSRRHILRLGRRACRTLVLEPALGPEGRLKTARRGVGRYTVRVTGRSAHTGLDPGDGASAIGELAHVIRTLHELTDAERGITVNVGVVDGGSRPNVVAARARAEVDVRIARLEDAEAIERRILALQPEVPGTRLEIRGELDRPPMERTPRNAALWEAARRLGASLGLDLEEGTSGGASDGNFTSLHTATLDGLGVVGGGAHARDEWADLARMPERAALLALLLLLPAELSSAVLPEASAGGSWPPREVEPGPEGH